MEQTEWIFCPICGSKTRDRLRENTVLAANSFLTGDKDFLSLDTEHPQCMKAAEFLEYEGVGE